MSQTAEIYLADFNQNPKFFCGATGFGRSYATEKCGLRENFFVVGTT